MTKEELIRDPTKLKSFHNGSYGEAVGEAIELITNSKQLVTNSHQLEQDELGTLCICAERYALGRRTYIVSSVCGIISSLVFELSDKDIYVLIQDIEEPFGGYGDECDKFEWMKLLEFLRMEREARRNEV